jgi:tetratricopeptide (TPR) repeat protein
MASLDDTQSRSPFIKPPRTREPQESSGPGCAMWGAIGGMGLLLALAIVGLAAAAGWTSGLRIAQGNATATYEADIDAQIRQISTDVAAVNLPLLQVRVEYLAEQTPGISEVAQLAQTATSLYIANQPTPTPTPTASLQATQTLEVESMSTEEAAPTTAPDGGYNLLALLDEARTEVRNSQWEEAIETLDIIISVDPQFEKSAVEDLMSQALNARALALFRSGESGLAQAITLANRAELYGPLNPADLYFEREVATLYLTARSRVNTSDYAGAIRYLNDVIALSPNYLNVQDLLIQEYIAYGDALFAGGQPCQAVQQYDYAGGAAGGKRVAAQTACEQGTATPQGFVGTPDPNAPAPIGVQ